MATPAAIPAIRPGHRVVLGAHKMLAARPTMSGSAKDPDLVDKI
jgi:hypothetical protein